jgi:hypothetical protein
MEIYMLNNELVANTKDFTLDSSLIGVAPLRINGHGNFVVFPRHIASGSNSNHSSSLHYYPRNTVGNATLAIEDIEEAAFIITKADGKSIDAKIINNQIKIENENGDFSGFRNFPDIGSQQIELLNILEKSITQPLTAEEYVQYLKLWSELLQRSSSESYRNESTAFQKSQDLINFAREENRLIVS